MLFLLLLRDYAHFARDTRRAVRANRSFSKRTISLPNDCIRSLQNCTASSCLRSLASLRVHQSFMLKSFRSLILITTLLLLTVTTAVPVHSPQERSGPYEDGNASLVQPRGLVPSPPSPPHWRVDRIARGAWRCRGRLLAGFNSTSSQDQCSERCIPHPDCHFFEHRFDYYCALFPTCSLMRPAGWEKSLAILADVYVVSTRS